MSVEEIIARAMCSSPAWPVVFNAGSADALARSALAALDAAGYVVVPKERPVMLYEAFEAWLAEQHRSVGVTPTLQEARALAEIKNWNP